jgi:hypothetical protein
MSALLTGTTALTRPTTTDRGQRAARAGLWALPAYALLLGLSTWTHQPSIDDFDAYARYITTDVFLASHLGASILGAALAILGATAVTTLIAHGRAAGTAISGLVLTTVLQPAQPWTGFALAATTAALAVRLRRTSR